MPSTPTSPSGKRVTPKAYERFTGLETLRDTTAQDVGTKQPLFRLANGYIDAIGQVVKDPGIDRIQSAVNVVATKHLSLFDITWIESNSRTFTAKSSTGRSQDFAWSPSARPVISAWDGSLIYMAASQPVWSYSGAIFEPSPPAGPLSARIRPSFGVTVQSRFCVGGIPGAPGLIEISRVNDLNYFAFEEADAEESVNRAGKIDVWSVLGERQTLTGLVEFETNKLIIFTADRAIMYRISTDIDQWGIEDRTSITNGCISHNTIAKAGPSVLFCSRNGVYAIIRSGDNGTAVASFKLSDSISLLYRKMLRSVPDARSVSASWDQDNNQYHIFFPQNNDLSYRLTMTTDSTDFTSSAPRWSLSEGPFMPTCGDFYEGSLVYGGAEGLYQVGLVEEENHEINPDLIIETPILYLGAYDLAKDVAGIVLSASGPAEIYLELLDGQTDLCFYSRRLEAEERAVPGMYHAAPLTDVRTLPANERTKSLRLRITAKGKGLFRLAGFAFLIGS